MKSKGLINFIVLSTILTQVALGQDPFYAYHTKRVHSSTDYIGKYADLIVVLGEDKQLEFTRQTQYLPKWVTPEGTFMLDDFFPERELDHEFNYNYVRLMENGPEKIVVHWRYIPDISAIDLANTELNPTVIEGLTAAVHETFEIFPDGKILREVKDSRDSRYESWTKEGYGDKQSIQLNNDGVVHGSVVWGDKSAPLLEPIDGNEIITAIDEPVLAWTFDEGGGEYPEDVQELIEEIMEEDPSELANMTVESVTSEIYEIAGHMAVYKTGVSGTALGFDGYYTGIEFEEDIEIEDALTVETWVALDVFPFNEAALVQRSSGFGQVGFYLGVDAYGKVVLRINGSEIKSSETLPLYQWQQVTASIGKNSAKLFLNGVSVGNLSFDGDILPDDLKMTIGLNNEKERCTDYVRDFDQNITFIYGIQGLMDEVRIYDGQLSAAQIKKSFETFVPEDLTSPLAKAVLPGEVGVAPEFGATYKNLEHHELWDKMWRLYDGTDIVVKFDNNPASVVYWHGTNFAANWVTDNNRWMADQSSEIFTKHGCSEHMSDKQTRHSYARIIENSEARVMIHWRYPCVDVGYVCTDKRNWTDEYHTIYPDGTAVRKVIFNNRRPPGFQDIQFFTNPGETALDVVDIQAMTVANVSGETLDLVWKKPNINPQQKLKDATIELLNSKSEYKVFTVFQGGEISTWGSFEQSKYTDDPFAGPWNHWPISLVPSDGRFAVAHDRVTHFALGANDNAPSSGSMVHYGFTKESIEDVIPIARYWQNPPELENLSGASTSGFFKDEKSYLLSKEGDGKVSFTIQASNESPVINPSFVIENMTAGSIKVSVDGKRLDDKDYRVGESYNTDGAIQTVIWIATESTSPVSFEIVK